jgi:hypothetical protein
MYVDYNNVPLEKMESERKFYLYFNNPSLTLEFLEAHINENWDFEMLTLDSIITPEFMIKYKHKPWNFNYYKFLMNISMNQYLEVEDKINDYETLSRNHNIILEYIFSHSDKPWCWNEISKRRDVYTKHYDTSKPLNFYLIYQQAYYSGDFMCQYKDRIIIDFENYIENMNTYDKIKEQKIFIDLLLQHI